MKKLLLYLIILITGCSSEKDAFILTEYHFPLEGLEQGKTRIYQNLADGTRNYEYLKINDEGGKKVLISTHYTDTEKLDSSKWLITNDKITMIESYMNFYATPQMKNPILLTGDIKKHTRVNEVETIEVEYNLPEKSYAIFETNDVFEKDTVMVWNGTNVKCKKYQSDITITVGSKLNPLAKNVQETAGTYYHGKNLGLLKYSIKSADGISNWKLIESE